ncbi:MAG: hypothetical protein SV487_09875 [Thermodesulfobacteriota bacterium]|nr:hypothetical protein [Thermodesulfobacteriota bacterium]
MIDENLAAALLTALLHQKVDLLPEGFPVAAGKDGDAGGSLEEGEQKGEETDEQIAEEDRI